MPNIQISSNTFNIKIQMNNQNFHAHQALSQITVALLHDKNFISQQTLEKKQLMFRFSSNSQYGFKGFKKNQKTAYFHNSKERSHVKSVSPQNYSWETPINYAKTLVSQNKSHNQQTQSIIDTRKRRPGLVKVQNFDTKISKQKLEFSKHKRNISKFNKQNASPFPIVDTKVLSQQKSVIIEERKIFKQTPINLQDFEIGKRLGKGKFGEVYLVRQKRTNFICAMKKIPKQIICEEQFQEQLFRQIKIQLFLNHPNLIKMYGFFHDSTDIYILLEYCSCGTLYQKMCQGPKLTQNETSTIVGQILCGLQQLHYHRIFHRDLKPQNILIVHGVIKIGDFGWSVHHKKDQVRKTLCGTPLYFSPQVISGQNYDQKIDIWSLGIMTFQILVSKNPFKIRTQNQLIRIVQQQVMFPEGILISEQAKDFILKMLTKDPKLRLQASELLNHNYIKH